jgi:hypothetical protein
VTSLAADGEAGEGAAGEPEVGASGLTMARCEWCGQESDRLEQIRHWEEHGSFGPPVYSVCPRCAEKEREGREAAAEEWAAYMEPRYTTEAARPEEGREKGAAPSSG